MDTERSIISSPSARQQQQLGDPLRHVLVALGDGLP